MAKRKNTIQKPQRGLGQALNSTRGRLRREIAAEQKRARTRVLDELGAESRRQEFEDRPEYRMPIRYSEALLRVVSGAQQAVVDSYGVDVPIRAKLAFGMTAAMTDMKSIYISWGAYRRGDVTDAAQRRLDAMTVKGLCQHELGHVLFSISPREIMGHPDTQDLFKAHYEAGQSIRQDELLHTINVLEDQRMECLMVEEVPLLGQYFTVMVLSEITSKPISRFCLLAGRDYLPQSVLDAVRAPIEDKAARQWDRIVRRYKAADSVKAILDVAMDAMEWMRRNGSTSPKPTSMHDNPKVYETTEQMSEEDAAQADQKVAKHSKVQDDLDDDLDDDGNADGGESSNADGGESSNADGGESSDDQSSDDQAGQTDESGEAAESPSQPSNSQQGADETDADAEAAKAAREAAEQAAVKEAKDEAIEEALRDIEQVDGADLDEWLDKAAEIKDKQVLWEYPTQDRPLLSDSYSTLARNIEERLRFGLQKWVTAAAPVWHSHQEQGVLDPLAWRTHKTGERDFYRDRTGEGAESLDLHLSLLCDVSGSMAPHMSALSAVMYGTASACDSLGIDRTMTVWSDSLNSFRIWESTAPAPVLLETLGGTQPESALDDSLNHNVNGRRNHLVVVFTDGDWSDFSNLQNWKEEEGTKVLLLKFGPDAPAATYGADHSVHIDAVTDMEYHIAGALDDVLASIY